MEKRGVVSLSRNNLWWGSEKSITGRCGNPNRESGDEWQIAMLRSEEKFETMAASSD